MKNDLIARYIYAVTRHLPPKMRADVEKELDSLISDMLAQRCGDVLPTDQDIRVALTELGIPEEMAMKYSGDEKNAFISGKYFLIYKWILRLVLPIVAAGVAFAGILSVCLEWKPNPNPYLLIGTFAGRVIGGAVGGAMQAFAIITIAFAVLERKKVVFSDGDMLFHLPPVPKRNAQIKPHEPIINMMWSIFAAAFFIGFPQIAGAWLEGVGWIPVFATAVLRSLWLPLILWAVLGIAKETVKLIEGQYTKKLAAVTLAANSLILISAAFVFLNNHVMNPDFITHVSDLLVGGGGAAVSGLLANFHLFFFGIVCFALVLETTVTAVKTWKYSGD